jgi:hypothetical protein
LITLSEDASVKQCPRCNRTYPDDSLLYCLEDGSVLATAYDPDATQLIPEARPTNAPLPQPAVPIHQAPAPFTSPSYAPPRRRLWPLYLVIVLLLLMLGGGAIGLLIYGYTRMQDSPVANDNQSQASPSPAHSPGLSPEIARASPSPEIQNSPSPRDTPTATQLVGTWRTNVYEDKQQVEITYTFLANGSSKAVFKTGAGTAQTHYGEWRYSDSTLFETFASGASGKGAIRWIDHDNFELTIIDNGVPLYSGLKRRYRRIEGEATE